MIEEKQKQEEAERQKKASSKVSERIFINVSVCLTNTTRHIL
jgi:hypothetical protein